MANFLDKFGWLYILEIIPLHGVQDTDPQFASLLCNVLDRDPQFESCFWGSQKKASGTNLNLSTCTHNQMVNQNA